MSRATNISIRGGSIGFMNFGTIKNVGEIRADSRDGTPVRSLDISITEVCPKCEGLGKEDDAVCTLCKPSTGRRK